MGEKKIMLPEREKRYRQSEKGRLTIAKLSSKHRKLGHILISSNPFANSVLVDYHHITDTYVITVPRELHRLYQGRYHKEMMIDILKQIYSKDTVITIDMLQNKKFVEKNWGRKK